MWLLTIAVALLDRFDSDLTLPFISHILMCKSTGRMRRRLASPKHNQTAAPVVERLMQLRNVDPRGANAENTEANTSGSLEVSPGW